MSEPANRYIEVEGLRVFVREAGQGEPILLLHGIPTNSALWSHQLGTLARFGHAIAPDLPGYGRSDKPADATYTPAWYMDFVERFVHALGADKVSILCHDLGGFAGLAFAAEHPDLIRRLVIFNTSIYPDFRPPGRVRLLRAPPFSWSFMAAAPPRSALRLLIAGGFVNRRVLTPELLEEFHRPLRDRAARWAQLRFFRSVDSSAMQKMYRTWSERLTELQAPTLILWGRYDRWITLDAHGTRLARDIPNARLVALEAKHFVPLDAADAVNRELEAFFGPEVRGSA